MTSEHKKSIRHNIIKYIVRSSYRTEVRRVLTNKASKIKNFIVWYNRLKTKKLGKANQLLFNIVSLFMPPNGYIVGHPDSPPDPSPVSYAIPSNSFTEIGSQDIHPRAEYTNHQLLQMKNNQRTQQICNKHHDDSKSRIMSEANDIAGYTEMDNVTELDEAYQIV